MPITASALALSFVLSTGAASPEPADASPADPSVSVTAVRPVAASVPTEQFAGGGRRWLAGARPAPLLPLYAAFGAMQGLDVWSTRSALDRGAHEANPIVREAAGSTPAMLAVKALSTAGSIYFTERLWKKNRKASIALMAALNGVTGFVVARNVATAR